MNELSFRKLNADEISVRIGNINAWGVSLLLYKDARCDQEILDQTVGPLGWQRIHSRDNKNCVVSIWDKDKEMWVSKEDTGTESYAEAEKGKASDSFKRACVNWGIGRELYTAPDMFVFKDDLTEFSSENGKNTCKNTFKCLEIHYDGSKIRDLAIGVYDKKKNLVAKKAFSNVSASSNQVSTGSAGSKAPLQQKGTPTKAVATTSNAATTSSGAKTSAVTGLLPDDEVLLFGSCKGKRYGDVKETQSFKSFLNWLKGASPTYSDTKTQNQYNTLKKQVA